jgi:hypothetical protein
MLRQKGVEMINAGTCPELMAPEGEGRLEVSIGREKSSGVETLSTAPTCSNEAARLELAEALLDQGLTLAAACRLAGVNESLAVRLDRGHHHNLEEVQE